MKYTTQRISLRIPSDLHEKLLKEADETSKSMNAEIIARLQNSFSEHPPVDELALRKIISEELTKVITSK